ncbi:hypothetical protein LTR28_001637, partial [Elasticomyces elasticus]
VFYTVLYIAPFYLSPTLRATSSASRDSPAVIKARARAVLLVSLAVTAITTSVLVFRGNATPREIVRLFGLWPAHGFPLRAFVSDTVKSVLLVCVNFLGPLYEWAVAEGEWRNVGWANLRRTVWDDWVGFRNQIVGPVSEEVIFRSLAVSLYLLAQVDPKTTTFQPPLIFGLAHLHHLHSFLQSHTPPTHPSLLPPLRVLIPGLLRSAMQFAYTSLFGFFATFLFLRTGNVWSVILAHSFCNWMGLPRVWGRVGVDAGAAVGSAARDGDRGDGGKAGLFQMRAPESADELRWKAERGAAREGMCVGWTVAYYLLLVVGAVAFWRLLWPLTESGNALARF